MGSDSVEDESEITSFPAYLKLITVRVRENRPSSHDHCGTWEFCYRRD